MRYEIRAEAERPSTWTIEVIPQGEHYEVHFTVSQSVPAQGFSLQGGVMEAMLPEAVEVLFSVLSFWGREIELGKTYILRERARLVTEKQIMFLGIPVVAARLLHPRHPDLRVTVYVPRLSHQPLLPLPPYLRVEEERDGIYHTVREIELVEFVHER